MCWIDDKKLALVLQQDSYSFQLGILEVNGTKSKANYQLLKTAPHSGDLRCVTALSSTQILTAGDDKVVIHWDLSDEMRDPQITKYDQRHTASIQALHPSSIANNRFYSGGCDKKFFQWDVERKCAISDLIFSNPLTHVIENPVDKNLLLICLHCAQKQLCLFDPRSNKVIQEFGWTESSSFSRYIRPSWQRGGYLVAIGSPDSLIRIWDIRFKSFNEKEPFLLRAHKKKVLRTEWHPVSTNRMLSFSTDNSLAFHQLQI